MLKVRQVLKELKVLKVYRVQVLKVLKVLMRSGLKVPKVMLVLKVRHH